MQFTSRRYLTKHFATGSKQMDYSIVVPYDSYEQYQGLKQAALQTHLNMIDTDLLAFKRRWALFEIGDLAHDTEWHEKSHDAFMALTLNHHKQWCSSMGVTLWFMLKQVLRATLIFVQKDIEMRPEAPMYKIQSVRRAVVQTIEAFLEDPCGTNWTTSFEDDNFKYANEDPLENDDYTLIPVAKVDPARKRKRAATTP